MPHRTCSRSMLARTGTLPTGAMARVSTEPGEALGAVGPAVGGGASPRSAARGAPSATTAAAAAARPAIAAARRRRDRPTSRVRAGSRVGGSGGYDEGCSRTPASTRSSRPGQAGEGLDRARALVAAGQVPLERETLGGAEGAEHVGGVVVGVRAAHALTPISSSASFSARSA